MGNTINYNDNLNENVRKVLLSGNYVKIIDFFENPTHSVKFRKNFIMDRILKVSRSVELFCFRFSIDKYELAKILNNDINFNFKTLVVLSLVLNCKISELFTE